MSGDPTPADTIPTYIQDGLERQDPETLSDIAQYATALAEYKAHQELDEPDADSEESPADSPQKDVPAKASIVTKTINDNEYYYWQWRDGDQVKSKYKGPVNADE